MKLFQVNNRSTRIPVFLLLIIFFSLVNVKMFSQAFLPPYQPTIGLKKGYVILNDCTKIEGTFNLINHSKNIKSCILKDKSGKKHSLKANQIGKVFIVLTGFDKLNAYSEITLNLKELLNINFREVFKPEYYVWEPVISNKKGKLKVVQLINPGFDSKMKVYRDPTAMQFESSEFSGTQELSYLVLKKGWSAAYKIKKTAYGKQFKILFADCPKLSKVFKDKKPRWEDFASHVFLYDQLKE